MKKVAWILFMLILLAGCKQSTESNGGGDDNGIPALSVTFVDAVWDGITVPFEGRCNNCGGNGFSPALRVADIPAGATIVLVEFNDLDYADLASNGGHGALYVMVNNRNTVTIPSVPEETFDLPDGVFMEHQHYAPVGEPGAYFGPCGCGAGNRYQAVVKAVARTESGDTVLARATIDLGRF